jgi:cobalt-zinc-cadmium efflux system outer membrane protein
MSARPEFRRFVLERDVLASRREQAALAPALEFGVDAEGLAGTGDYSGTSNAEIGFSLGSVFERGGKRAARVRAIDLRDDLLRTDQRIEAIDLIAETGRRFVAVAVEQERLHVAQQALAQARETVAMIAPRVAAARSPRIELLSAQIELSRAESAFAAAERGLLVAQRQLATQWSAPDERPVVDLTLFNVEEVASLDDLQRALNGAPDLARFAGERAVLEAEERLVRTQRLADWRWSLGVRRYEASTDQALTFAWSVPLGNASRNRASERELSTQLRVAEVRREERQLELGALLFRQVEELRGARARLLQITERELPLAREARVLAERGYRIGRFPYRELANSQSELIALENQRIDAAAAYHATRVEIERLTGARVSLIAEKP